MSSTPAYYARLAAAYVRGKLMQTPLPKEYQPLFAQPLDALSEDEMDSLMQLGIAQGLRLHRFKRTMDLARVRTVLGTLKGLQPRHLLDIGSGRGAFLWPLLDAFPDLPVTALDLLEYRVADMQAVHDGGIAQLTALKMDVTALAFANRSFDVVTMLEVLEHIPDTRKALAEVCRVAERAFVCSVPSKPDDNPEHIHLFDEPTLRVLLAEQGALHINVSYVLNHRIVVARMPLSR
ncbi:MAG TPA: class I SAM-dependent methyltransferase [Ktedonobacterales bacterium]|nr:class I SAM-dependent methyltransferase [Ktedonobacterales bacterium]